MMDERWSSWTLSWSLLQAGVQRIFKELSICGWCPWMNNEVYATQCNDLLVTFEHILSHLSLSGLWLIHTYKNKWSHQCCWLFSDIQWCSTVCWRFLFYRSSNHPTPRVAGIVRLPPNLIWPRMISAKSQKCPFSSGKMELRAFKSKNRLQNLVKHPPKWWGRHLSHAFSFSGEYQANFWKSHIFYRFGAV